MERTIECPGSVAAEREHPSDDTTGVAIEGQNIHRALETDDDEGLSDTEADIAEHLKALEQEALKEWLGQSGLTVAPPAIREERMWVRDPKTLRPVASAKVDVAYILGKRALVIDNKTGYVDATPAPSNWQLRTQAIALKDEYPCVSHVRVAISQHRFRSKFDPCDYSPSDLKEAKQELLHGLWAARQPNAPRRPGKWCDYCSAKAHCVQAAAYAMVARASIPGDLKSEVEAAVGLLSPQKLAHLWKHKSVSDKIWAACEDRLRAMSPEDLQAVGLTYRETGEATTVTDVLRAFEILHAEGLCTQDEFLSWCKARITSAEKVVVKRIAERQGLVVALGGLLSAKSHYRALLAPVITTKAKKPSIVALPDALK